MARYASPPLPQQQSDFEVHMAQAASLLAQGHIAPAVGLYRTAATRAEERGNYRNALRAYAEIVRLEGPQSDTQLKVGEMQYRSGRPREAASTLDQAANVALQHGRVEVGLHAYRLAALADPSQARWRQVLDWYVNLGKHAELVPMLEDASTELFRNEAYEGFIFVADHLLQHKPDSVATLRMLMRAHLQRKDLHRAAVTIQRLLDMRPGDADALERMAETFAELGRKDKAAEVVSRLAVMLSQDEASRDEAKRLVDRGLAWNPNNARLLAVKHSFAPPPPPRPAPARAPVEDIPALDLSEFVEVVPGDFDEPDYTMVRELDILEVNELTMVTRQFDLSALAGELHSKG